MPWVPESSKLGKSLQNPDSGTETNREFENNPRFSGTSLCGGFLFTYHFTWTFSFFMQTIVDKATYFPSFDSQPLIFVLAFKNWTCLTRTSYDLSGVHVTTEKGVALILTAFHLSFFHCPNSELDGVTHSTLASAIWNKTEENMDCPIPEMNLDVFQGLCSLQYDRWASFPDGWEQQLGSSWEDNNPIWGKI